MDALDGPLLCDPPEAEWTLLEQVVSVTAELGERLRREPHFPRPEALAFVKLTAPACSLFFGTLIWPRARRLAGLRLNGRGRPRKNDVIFENRV